MRQWMYTVDGTRSEPRPERDGKDTGDMGGGYYRLGDDTCVFLIDDKPDRQTTQIAPRNFGSQKEPRVALADWGIFD